jgi:hypothetical protein
MEKWDAISPLIDVAPCNDGIGDARWLLFLKRSEVLAVISRNHPVLV